METINKTVKLAEEPSSKNAYNNTTDKEDLHAAEKFSLSNYDDDEDDSGFCCPCCLPR